VWACAPNAPVVEAPSPYRPKDSAEVQISLERSTCYGTCPAYKVSVDGAGNVRYEGEQFVAQTGVHEWKVNPARVEHLLKVFARMNFFDMKFDCRRTITDVPTETIGLRVGGRVYSLANRWGGIDELSIGTEDSKLEPDLDVHALLDWLADWIDEALDTETYVRGAQPR
jgi:hypothetical protein